MGATYNQRLSKDIDISVLRQLRADGLTNKRIAERVGCSVSTIYRYLGKKSFDVANAAAQNKPSPIIENVKIESAPKPKESVAYETPIRIVPKLDPPETSVPKLTLIDEIIIRNMSGILCKYKINDGTGDIEMYDGVVTGLLDRDSLSVFIDELQEIKKML